MTRPACGGILDVPRPIPAVRAISRLLTSMRASAFHRHGERAFGCIEGALPTSCAACGAGSNHLQF